MGSPPQKGIDGITWGPNDLQTRCGGILGPDAAPVVVEREDARVGLEGRVRVVRH